jgi:hypothetical protein
MPFCSGETARSLVSPFDSFFIVESHKKEILNDAQREEGEKKGFREALRLLALFTSRKY